MKTLKIEENLYSALQEVAHMQGVDVGTFIPKALEQGITAIKEEVVLEQYRRRKISLQRAAEILSIDIWSMIDKIRDADIHLDYSMTELMEDISA